LACTIASARSRARPELAMVSSVAVPDEARNSCKPAVTTSASLLLNTNKIDTEFQVHLAGTSIMNNLNNTTTSLQSEQNRTARAYLLSIVNTTKSMMNAIGRYGRPCLRLRSTVEPIRFQLERQRAPSEGCTKDESACLELDLLRQGRERARTVCMHQALARPRGTPNDAKLRLNCFARTCDRR